MLMSLFRALQGFPDYLQGPLKHMDDVELQHWMHIAGSRATVIGCDVLEGLLATSLGRLAEKQQDFQVHCVGPAAHTLDCHPFSCTHS